MRNPRNLPFRQRFLLAAALPAAAVMATAGMTEPAEAHVGGRWPAAVAGRRAPSADVWARLRHCESSGRYTRNTGNGYYGAYQFKPSTWRSLGYRGLPHRAAPAVQDRAARRLQAREGWGQWPACARRLGLRR
jgi:hypothetical protein